MAPASCCWQQDLGHPCVAGDQSAGRPAVRQARLPGLIGVEDFRSPIEPHVRLINASMQNVIQA